MGGEDGATREIEYDDRMVAYLEAIWGQGFLSPGGPEEIAAILEGSDIAGLLVLDIGCGIGGCDLELVQRHGAGRVIGIDIEPQLVARCDDLAVAHGLSDRLEFRLVEPGPLPFEDASFDCVFSKDAMIHIPDKEALFAEVLRVLRPGGIFLASDWLRGLPEPESEDWKAWRQLSHLTFRMARPEETQVAMASAGFAAIEVRDRRAWFSRQTRQDLERLKGEAREALIASQGEDGAVALIERTAYRIKLADSGELLPCHLKGRRPPV